MDIDKIDPALHGVTEKSVKLNLENGFIRWSVASLSSLMRGKKVDGVTRRIIRDDAVRVRVYEPEQPTGAGLLWVHGGGLILGSAAVDDVMCGETARETGITVVSVDYGLAPKHPFPGPLDDCSRAFAWMLANAHTLGIDPSRVAVGGQSAGGGLAASLVQRLHDEGVRLAAQWLFCPMLDDRTAADRSHDAEDHYVWNNRFNLVGWRSYLGDRVGAEDLPAYAVAARRDDLSGFPPTWMYSSDVELFYAEDVDYAARLREHGVDVHFETIAGAPHGFEAWAPETPMAKDLVSSARGWLQERLA